MASEITEELLKLSTGTGESIVQYCEDFELDMKHLSVSIEESILAYKIHLLGHLLAHDLVNARFLWKRIPQEQRDSESHALWNIGKCMWKHEHANVQVALNAEWSPIVKPMCERLKLEYTCHAFLALGRAYRTINASKLQNLMGKL